MKNLIVCNNPRCNNEYPISDNKSDDGYCSQECWEDVHIGSFNKSYDIMDVTAESLLSA